MSPLQNSRLNEPRPSCSLDNPLIVARETNARDDRRWQAEETVTDSTVSESTPVDTFQGAGGEGDARAFEVYGYAFMA